MMMTGTSFLFFQLTKQLVNCQLTVTRGLSLEDICYWITAITWLCKQ